MGNPRHAVKEADDISFPGFEGVPIRADDTNPRPMIEPLRSTVTVTVTGSIGEGAADDPRVF